MLVEEEEEVMVSNSPMIAGDPSCLHREYKYHWSREYKSQSPLSWRRAIDDANPQEKSPLALNNYLQFTELFMIPTPDGTLDQMYEPP